MANRASDERIWEFQTRLMEKALDIGSRYRTNSSTLTEKPPTGGYATSLGTIPQTMTVRVGTAGGIGGSTSLLSTPEDDLGSWKFVDLPASIAQKLTPKVEVYKVYPAETEGQPDRAYLLHQGAYKVEDARRELRKETITATDNNRRGVVLQAVDFTRLGGNPAEVHTNIKFNIKLYAKNITEFFTKADSFPDTYDEGTTAHLLLDDRYDDIQDAYSSALRARDTALRAQAASTDAVIADLLAAGQNEAALRASNLADGVGVQEAEAALANATPAAADLRREYIDATDLKQTAWIDIIKIDPGQELTAAVGNPRSPNQPSITSNQLQVTERGVRIKVKISYSLKGGIPTDISPDDWTKWQEVVDEQREEFSLSLLKHEWSFLGMQGVELSVDFIATGNANALQPDKDVLGGLSWQKYQKLKRDEFSSQKGLRETLVETMNALRNDILIHESRLQEISSLIAANDATITVLEDLVSDYEKLGTDTFILDGVTVTGNQAAATLAQSIELSTARGANILLTGERQEIGTAIEDVREKIASCEEKIGVIAEEEGVMQDEISDVKSAIRLRILQQLYLGRGYGGTPTDRGTRVFRAKVPTTLSYISQITYLTPQLDRREGWSGTRVVANTEDLTALDGNEMANLTQVSDDSVYTLGNFAFLGDIIEAAYECIYRQVTEEVSDLTELERELREANEAVENEASTRSGRALQNNAVTRAEIRQEAAESALQMALIRPDPDLAELDANDFLEFLNKVDVVTTGMVTYPDPSKPDNSSITINISDIPISLDLFRAWWIGKARAMNSYAIRDFIPDLMEEFVTDMFKNLKYRDGIQPVEMKDYELPRFILNNVSNDDTRVPIMTNEKGRHLSLTGASFLARINLAKSSQGSRSTTVIEQADVLDMPKSDVPNIIFGRADKGILKQVSFEREDIPGHAEARLMTDRDSVASNIALREKYNVTLEMRGTTSFLPGSVLYLDITPIELGYTDEDDSYAKQLGLGGMYRVVSVQSSLGLDGKGNSWTTRLKTKWESFGDGTNGDPSANLASTTLSNGECQ